MMTLPSRQGFRRGFSLLELLVVIGIIIILVGILFPVIGKVRTAAQIADTTQEISQLSNAITQYYSDFHAYPGPFSNDQIEGGPGLPPAGITLDVYTPPATVGGTGTWQTGQNLKVTGTENLVLGLLGGLNFNPADGLLGFRPDEVGSGPLSLNTANPRRYSSYVQATSGSSGLLMWCSATAGSALSRLNQYTPGATLTSFADEATHHANDSIIPEFVDRFPTPGPMPILYLRARVGAPGIVSDQATLDPNGNAITYQYDLRDIMGYTAPSNGNPPVSIALPPPVPPAPYSAHNLVPNPQFTSPTPDITFVDVKDVVANTGIYGPQVQLPSGNVIGARPDAGAYFKNGTVPPTNATNDTQYNYTGRPRAADQFILISAGPDGIYGTTDDITSFGSVAP